LKTLNNEPFTPIQEKLLIPQSPAFCTQIIFSPEKPGPLGPVRDVWLCQKSLQVPKARPGATRTYILAYGIIQKLAFLAKRIGNRSGPGFEVI
jgi:hypothetical protein